MPIFRPGKPKAGLARSTDYVNVAAPGGLVDLDVVEFLEGDITAQVSPHAIVVDLAGLYMVTSGLRLGASALPAVRTMNARLNGAPFIVEVGPTSSTNSAYAGARMADLVEGDTLDLTLNGIGVLVQAAATFLQVARIGPVRWT